MDPNKQLKTKLSMLDRRKNPELIRFELYSCIVAIIYSDIFSKNAEIKVFLEAADIKFKDYVYLSKTLIIARAVKEIKKFSDDQLFKLLDIMKAIVLSDLYNSPINERKNARKENYIDSILDQFSRRS